MKIAHLISNYPLPLVGGAEMCTHNVALEEVKKGHTVKVIAPHKVNLPQLDYEVLPLRPYSVRMAKIPLFKDLYFVNQLRSYQKRYGFDIWQVTIGYPFGVAAVDFFNRNGIPCVLRCSGEDIQTEPDINYGVRLRRGPNFLIGENYKKFDGLVSIIASITDEYVRLGVPLEKIHYIPNGIRGGIFETTVKTEDIKRSLGIDPAKKLILTVGRNHPKKGFGLIPDIIEKLLRVRDDFVWLLIGLENDDIRQRAQKRSVGRFLITKDSITKSKSEDTLTYPNRELVEIYRTADVFAFPTFIEGRSNVIMESMANSLPVVSTDVPGVRDIVKDGRTGLLSEKGDIEGMALNIERILSDTALAENIRQNALRETKGLDWSTIADRYITLYESVIKKKRLKA